LSELFVNALKIGGSLCLLSGVLYAASLWSRRARLHPEISRKFIHVGLGLYCLTFPLQFAHTWQVALTCALAIGVFALARGRLRLTLGAGLHAVARRSYGEMYFALAVVLLFAQRQLSTGASNFGDVLYVLPIAILTVSDAAAALIGARFGRLRFAVAEGTKSCEGVAAFAVSAWVLSFAALASFTAMSATDAMLVGAVVALVGAAIEALSGHGLDNLLVPLGVHVALIAVTAGGQLNWIAVCALLAATLLALATIIHRRRSMPAGAP
jgi:phytol kinase